ncbi:MAG: hypothetical protein L0Y72_25315 [Gemmataceae bacterium]|nr:hypothetical protein [Gemmataceae bacterium]MCI0742365.1 hypothetical protein [Gemmataceae bacterium]
MQRYSRAFRVLALLIGGAFGGLQSAAQEPGKLLPPTREDIEGPYHRKGAPFRSVLFDKGDKGKTLVLSGDIVNQEGKPLAGAILDIWQATPDGRYDNDDADKPPPKDVFRFRGKVKADKDGKYEFTTLFPGAYQIGPKQYRPPHIHFKLTQPGYKELTTQLYFKGDPYNKLDPFYHPTLEIEPAQKGDRYLALFRFVLAKKK